MLAIKLDTQNELAKAFAKIEQSAYQQVGDYMALRANQYLEEFSDGRDYTTSIDGRPVLKTAPLNIARKKIVFIFAAAGVVNFAVSGFKETLQRHMRKNAPKKDWMNFMAVQDMVSVSYLKKGARQAQRLGPTSVIKNFADGDVVFITPDYPTQVYANATKYGGGGFMRKAARAIERQLNNKYGTGKQNSPFSIRAERASGVWWRNLQQGAPLRTAKNGQSGTPIKMTIPKPGMASAWTIAIRRKNPGRYYYG